MMLRGALLSFRIQRFEATLVITAAVLSVLVSAVVILSFGAGDFGRCLGDDPAALGSACQTGVYPWLNRIARLSLSIVPIFPLVAGLLAGSPIVARELETGTARLAWSLGPSRLRWLVQRALPILVMVTIASLAIGLTADALIHLLRPSVDLDQSFTAFRGRGLLIAVEGLLVAAVACALGAILGRSGPTLVFSLILVFAIGMAVDKVERDLLTNEAAMADGNTYAFDDVNLFVGDRLRFPDGTILTFEEAMATHPEIQNGWDESSGITNVVLYIPGPRYHDVERREALALLAIAAGFLVLAAVSVVRRRPR